MVSEILSATFVLAVQNLEASRAFYIDRLGFTEDLAVPGWSFLSRGACKLRIGDCPGIKPMSESQDHSWFAYLHIDDAETLYRRVMAQGVQIWHRIADTPWGMREFGIVTLDGHRIVFGQRLSE